MRLPGKVTLKVVSEDGRGMQVTNQPDFKEVKLEPIEAIINDWQLTAIDYRTGYRVFYIRPYFDKKVFKDNAGLITKAFSMGNKNYDRKVFNNIWGTYTFGPNNSIYIGTYRGFIRFKSD